MTGFWKKRMLTFMAYYDAVTGVEHEMVEAHRTPIWVNGGSGRQWAVRFREKRMKRDRALLTGHADRKDDAYRMLYEYYMDAEKRSWSEIELIAAVAGADI